MESVKSKQELDRLLQGLEQENNERAVMSVTADKYDRCEYKKNLQKILELQRVDFRTVMEYLKENIYILIFTEPELQHMQM